MVLVSSVMNQMSTRLYASSTRRIRLNKLPLVMIRLSGGRRSPQRVGARGRIRRRNFPLKVWLATGFVLSMKEVVPELLPVVRSQPTCSMSQCCVSLNK